MTHAELALRVGAFTALFALVHNAVDVLFQSHAEAMAKHANWRVRAKHCLIYTSPFVPLLLWIGVDAATTAVCANVLFWSHFFEDTYWPVFMWAKYMRRPPEMRWRVRRGESTYYISGVGGGPFATDWRFQLECDLGTGKIGPKEAQRTLDRRGFAEFIDTTLGKMLMIWTDQIVHWLFLLPVAWCAAQVG